MSFQIRTPETFPYQIQPGTDTWNLLDLRTLEVIDTRPRVYGHPSSAANWEELNAKAVELHVEYTKH